MKMFNLLNYNYIVVFKLKENLGDLISSLYKSSLKIKTSYIIDTYYKPFYLWSLIKYLNILGTFKCYLIIYKTKPTLNIMFHLKSSLKGLSREELINKI